MRYIHESVVVYISIFCFPSRPPTPHRHAKVTITAIWLGALFTALPIPIVSRLQQPLGDWHEHCDRYVCAEDWIGREEWRFAYTSCLMSVQFVVPLLVLVYTYTRIAYTVWIKRVPGEAENLRDRRLEKAKRKVSECGAAAASRLAAVWWFDLLVAMDL